MIKENKEHIVKNLGNYQYQIYYQKVTNYMSESEQVGFALGALFSFCGFLVFDPDIKAGLLLFMIGISLIFLIWVSSERRRYGYLVTLASIDDKKKTPLLTEYVQKDKDPVITKARMASAVSFMIRMVDEKLLQEEKEKAEEQAMIEGL